jgi:hypothetical protein
MTHNMIPGVLRPLLGLLVGMVLDGIVAEGRAS